MVNHEATLNMKTKPTLKDIESLFDIETSTKRRKKLSKRKYLTAEQHRQMDKDFQPTPAERRERRRINLIMTQLDADKVAQGGADGTDALDGGANEAGALDGGANGTDALDGDADEAGALGGQSDPDGAGRARDCQTSLSVANDDDVSVSPLIMDTDGM